MHRISKELPWTNDYESARLVTSWSAGLGRCSHSVGRPTKQSKASWKSWNALKFLDFLEFLVRISLGSFQEPRLLVWGSDFLGARRTSATSQDLIPSSRAFEWFASSGQFFGAPRTSTTSHDLVSFSQAFDWFSPPSPPSPCLPGFLGSPRKSWAVLGSPRRPY